MEARRTPARLHHLGLNLARPSKSDRFVLQIGSPALGTVRRHQPSRFTLNKKDHQTRTLILHALCEGVSQRACERIFGVSNKTVAKLFEEAGDMASALMESLRDLQIENIQADELHSFVAARAQNVGEMLTNVEGAGTAWCYIAVCAKSKLVIANHVGSRTEQDATTFFWKIAKALARKGDGSFLTRPQINTDGLKAYIDAFNEVFGEYADHGVMQKKYSHPDKDGEPTNRSRYIGADRIKRSGNPRTENIHTSFIERQNLNARMGNRRLTRKTNAFSKVLLNHKRHLDLWSVYHNFCWLPRPKRVTVVVDGQRKVVWVKQPSAAQAAGVTKSLWSVSDLVKLTDKFIEARQKAQANEPPAPEVQAVDPLEAPFWVYLPARTNLEAKVHASTCCNCRGGQGRNVNASGNDGQWLPFATRKEAEEAAERLRPRKVVTCRMCLGERRKMAGINT